MADTGRGWAGKVVGEKAKTGKTEGGSNPKGKSTAPTATPGAGWAGAQLGAAAPGKEGNAGTKGGTSVQDTPTPGSTEVYGNSNAAAVADMLSQGIPGAGLTAAAYKGAKAIAGEDTSYGPLGDMLGADKGKLTGYQPDRYKGRAQQTGLGAAEGDSSGERDIAGRPYGAGTMALTGDPADPISGGDGGYSDEVMLRDRRKPRATGAGTQMLLA